jgi:branched-chain amino acid aminotransferase
MLQATEKIWMNGAFVKWDDAKVHVLTHTLHYGTGVFEGIRCYKADSGSVVFRLQEHVDRLFGSAHIHQMDIPFTRETVTEAILETIRVNKIDACYIRPLAYIGYGGMGVYPKNNPVHLSIAVWPWGSYLGEEGVTNGIRVKISSFSRPHVNSTMSRSRRRQITRTRSWPSARRSGRPTRPCRSTPTACKPEGSGRMCS